MGHSSKIVAVALAGIGFFLLTCFGIFAILSTPPRSPDWTGFYYRGVQGRAEPLSAILKNPDARSQAGAFRTVEACQDWAEFVRLKDGAAAVGREDLFYCARNCRVVKGAGADCGDSQASVFIVGE